MTRRYSVYLDYNASSPLRPEALHALQSGFARFGNAASVHGIGQQAKMRLEKARATFATLLDIPAQTVFFTSGGTESNALALWGTLPHVQRVYVGATEHPALLKNARKSCTLNKKALDIVPVFKNGTLDLKELERQFSQLPVRESFLASFMAANHETGVLHPLGEISQLCKKHGGYLHSDASQALGKISMNEAISACDLITLSAHKMGGPCGIGALIMKAGTPFTPLIEGGGQEDGVRPGTPAIPLIEAFVAAAQAALSPNAQTHLSHLQQAHASMEAKMLQADRHITIWGEGALRRLPQTTCVSMPGIPSTRQLMQLDLKGFSVSAGSACSAGLRGGPSEVLKAMDNNVQEDAIRISSGFQNIPEDLYQFTEAWLNLFHTQSTSERKIAS